MRTLTLPRSGYKRLFDINRVVEELAQTRQHWRESQQRLNESGGRHLPSRDVLSHIMENLCGILFPMRLGPVDLHQESEDFYVGHTLDTVLHPLLSQVQLELRAHSWLPNFAAQDEATVAIVRAFSLRLLRVRTLLDSDVLAAFSGDSAARNVDEVLLCYPGIVAMIYRRVAHNLHTLGVPLIARIVAEHAYARHRQTRAYLPGSHARGQKFPTREFGTTAQRISTPSNSARRCSDLRRHHCTGSSYFRARCAHRSQRLDHTRCCTRCTHYPSTRFASCR